MTELIFDTAVGRAVGRAVAARFVLL